MNNEPSLDDLWDSASSGQSTFQPDQVPGLPDAARRYLEHAIAPGTRLASVVRLRMHGQIRLQRWLPFKAEQVICLDRGMVWRASVRMHGIPIRGSDSLVDGKGSMRWKLLGIVPVMTASGPDISRSAAGRVAAESVWLPSALCREDVSWETPDPSRPRAVFTVQGHRVGLDLTVDDQGRLKTVQMLRWGNPGGGEFRDVDFGGIVEAEHSFGGYTIPSRLRVGWYFGSPRFESEGEFFRVTIDDATYR